MFVRICIIIGGGGEFFPNDSLDQFSLIFIDEIWGNLKQVLLICEMCRNNDLCGIFNRYTIFQVLCAEFHKFKNVVIQAGNNIAIFHYCNQSNSWKQVKLNFLNISDLSDSISEYFLRAIRLLALITGDTMKGTFQLTSQNLIAGAKPSWQQLSNSLSSPTKKASIGLISLISKSKSKFSDSIFSSDSWRDCSVLTSLLQVNLCQKHLLSYQLTHNMTTDCSLKYEFSTWKLQAQNMLCTQICSNIQNNLCTQYVLNMSSTCPQHVLSLQFSCTELVI